MSRREDKLTWTPVSPTRLRFSHYGRVQRRRRGWYAVLSDGGESGPFRLQKRAQGIVEAHAVLVRAAEFDDEQALETERAFREAHPHYNAPPKRRKRRHRIAGTGAYPEKLRCDACGIVMQDSEPCDPSGEGQYDHPQNDCRNAGKSFNSFPEQGQSRYQGVRGIAQVVPKRFRRAKRRGAKLASRHRPR